MGIDNVKLYKTASTTEPEEPSDEFTEDFQKDTYVDGETPTLDTTSNLDANMYKTASENGNKYLQVGGSLSAGYGGSGAKYVRVPVTTKLDLLSTADDSIYALEYDFKSAGTGARYRISLSDPSNANTEVILVGNTLYYANYDYTEKKNTPITGPTFSDGWHKIKIVYYTQTKTYGLFLDGKNVGLATYYQPYATLRSDFVPTYLGIRIENISGEVSTATLGIDNIKIYKTDGKFTYYGSPKLWSGYSDNNPVDVTTGFTKGTITAEVDIINLTDDAVPVAVLVALYNGDRLEKVSFASGNYTTNTIKVPAQIYTDLEVSAVEGRTLKVFLWDGVSTLRPLSENVEFAPAA